MSSTSRRVLTRSVVRELQPETARKGKRLLLPTIARDQGYCGSLRSSLPAHEPPSSAGAEPQETLPEETSKPNPLKTRRDFLEGAAGGFWPWNSARK